MAAIGIAFIISLASTTVKDKSIRVVLSFCGAIIAAGMVIGLFYFKTCYGQAKSISSRQVFLVKDIAWKEEVPDAMLPLFDEDFRKEIIAARKKAETQRK